MSLAFWLILTTAVIMTAVFLSALYRANRTHQQEQQRGFNQTQSPIDWLFVALRWTVVSWTVAMAWFLGETVVIALRSGGL